MQVLSNFYGTDGKVATVTKEGPNLYCNLFINGRIVQKIFNRTQQELEDIAEDYVSNNLHSSVLLNE
mgnify:FL=1|jgi:hypothetical protein